MTRVILILMLGFSMLATFPVQALDRDWHQHKLKQGHQYNHSGGHFQFRNARHRGCKHRSHKHYRGQVQFFTIPQVAGGTRYGYSATGKVIVYRTHALNPRRQR